MTDDKQNPDIDLRSVPLSELESRGYARLTWTCTMCSWLCSQGLRLMRIRRQATATSTIASLAANLRCPKCSHRPDANAVNPTRV